MYKIGDKFTDTVKNNCLIKIMDYSRDNDTYNTIWPEIDEYRIFEAFTFELFVERGRFVPVEDSNSTKDLFNRTVKFLKEQKEKEAAYWEQYQALGKEVWGDLGMDNSPGPTTWEFITPKCDEQLPISPRCECGAHKVRNSHHSDWCPVY